MEQGVCVYDADNRIVLVNQRYLKLFEMSADIVRVGTSYRDVLGHSVALGNIPAGEVDALYAVADRVDRGRPAVPDRADARERPRHGARAEAASRRRLDDDLRRRQPPRPARGRAALQTERSQHALANMSHGLIMYDADSRVVVCNDRFLNSTISTPTS